MKETKIRLLMSQAEADNLSSKLLKYGLTYVRVVPFKQSFCWHKKRLASRSYLGQQ
jgi:hypothetical protein